jgi:hypothetical protein
MMELFFEMVAFGRLISSLVLFDVDGVIGQDVGVDGQGVGDVSAAV